MFKKILFLCGFFCVSLFSQSSYEIAKVISNADEAKLRLLFSRDYLDGYTHQNIEKISEILQTNSLFKVALDSPKDINIEFYAKSNSILFLNTITNMLHSLGFVHFYITEFSKNDDNLKIKITLQSSFLIDPGQVYTHFRQSRIYITQMKRLAHGDYGYYLDFSKFSVNADLVLSKGNVYKLTKPLRMYFVSVESAVKSINITTNVGDIWYPKIEFLDKNLNLIQSISSINLTKSLDLDIPAECKYIKIGDNFAIENIKRGLNITTK